MAKRDHDDSITDKQAVAEDLERHLDALSQRLAAHLEIDLAPTRALVDAVSIRRHDALRRRRDGSAD
jgi:hypothetical protein